MEDIDKSHEYLGSHLKIWADRYGFRAEVKNDSAVMRPEKIYVTSNYHPKEIFTDESVLAALLDRFVVIEVIAMKEFDDGIPPTPKKRKLQRTDAFCRACYTDPCSCTGTGEITMGVADSQHDIINLGSDTEISMDEDEVLSLVI